MNSLIKFEESSGGQPAKIKIFGGSGYTSEGNVVNYYETWFYNIVNSQNEKIENVQEKLLDIFIGNNFCWTF